ncbi:hypothetical protein C6H69_07625 [Photorhabdus luminescens]|nr:hypothetical protein C6H69_07625 [Photorhabdus luminescens]
MLRTSPSLTFPSETLSLDALMIKNHLVHKIDSAIDFEFIRELATLLYCHNNGRLPIDPVILLKMMLLSYLFGILSESTTFEKLKRVSQL